MDEKRLVEAVRLAVREELAEFRDEVREELAEFKDEVREELAEFKDEVRQELAAVKGKIDVIETRLDKIEERLKIIERDVILFKLNMETFEKHLRMVEQNVADTMQYARNLGILQENIISKRLDAIYDLAANVKAKFNDLDFVAAKQEDHGHRIFGLEQWILFNKEYNESKRTVAVSE